MNSVALYKPYLQMHHVDLLNEFLHGPVQVLYLHFTERWSVLNHANHCWSDSLRLSSSDQAKNAPVLSHIGST